LAVKEQKIRLRNNQTDRNKSNVHKNLKRSKLWENAAQIKVRTVVHKWNTFPIQIFSFLKLEEDPCVIIRFDF